MGSSCYIEVPTEDVNKVMRALDGTYYHNRQIRCHTDKDSNSRAGNDSSSHIENHDGRGYGRGGKMADYRGGNRQREPRGKAGNVPPIKGVKGWQKIIEQIGDINDEGWARRKPRKKK
jgi:ATP-dependent RNA helicase DeaD